MPFNTYIDDKDMIPTLLDYGWIIWKEHGQIVLIQHTNQSRKRFNTTGTQPYSGR